MHSLATSTEPQPRRTDSPWFWAYLFSTAALIALLLMDGKYQHRQTDIEDVYRFGTRTLERSPGTTLSDNTPRSTADIKSNVSSAKASEPMPRGSVGGESSERAPLADGPQPPTHKMLIPLLPLRVITGLAMVVSFVAMQWSYSPPREGKTMNSWFVEDSTPVLVWGAIFEALLIFALVKSGRRWLLYAMVGLAPVVGAIVWHEKHTITDAKQIRATLYDAAAAMERNNLPGVLEFISPSAAGVRQQANQIASSFKVDEIHLADLKIQVNRFNVPPSATVNFFVRVSGVSRTGDFPFTGVLQRAQVTLRLENGRWLVSDYKQDADAS